MFARSSAIVLLLGCSIAFAAQSVDGPVQTITRDEAIPAGAEMQEDPSPETAFRDSNDTAIPHPASFGDHSSSASPEDVHHNNGVTGQPTVTEFKFASEGGNSTHPTQAATGAVGASVAIALLLLAAVY